MEKSKTNTINTKTPIISSQTNNKVHSTKPSVSSTQSTKNKGNSSITPEETNHEVENFKFYGDHESKQYTLPHQDPEFWKLVKEHIEPISKSTSSAELAYKAIKFFAEKFQDKENYETGNLKKYVETFQKEQQANIEKIIQIIASLVLQTPILFKDKLCILTQNIPLRMKLSKVQVACLLSNMFFGTLLDQKNSNMVRDRSFCDYFDSNFIEVPLSSEKIKCIFNYFEEFNQTKSDENLIIQRSVLSLHQNNLDTWLNCKEPLSKVTINPEGGIEDSENSIEIDFANKYLGGGALYLGMMQEEIMMMTSPECLVAIVLSEYMLDHEAILIYGPRHISTYEGYGDDFICTGKVKQKKGPKRLIAAIDALCMLDFETGYQYKPEAIVRDLNKAYVGFLGLEESKSQRVVSSGKWGCGVFKNDPEMKFIQQWISASRAKKNMEFYTKGKGEYSDNLIKIIEIMKKENTGSLVRKIFGYFKYKAEENGSKSLFEYMGL